MKELLKGMVIAKFGSITAFCKQSGWHPRRAWRIINGEQELKKSDIIELTRLLDLRDVGAFMLIFFNELSTLRTLEVLL